MTEALFYSPATWRLLVDAEADGATNMSVDEAILAAVVEGKSPPTLRFYEWAPPCLSLGRGQCEADASAEACRAAGVDLVRRPTGGRAILHADELTYSVALLQSDPRATGDVVESYRRLSGGLVAGLRMLGVDATQALGTRKGSGAPPAACFEAPSEYEITVGGCKLMGSAQWRARGGVLQHGTLPLSGDITRIVDYLAFPAEQRPAQRQALRSRAVTLEEALGREATFSEAVQALVSGFAQALNLTLVQGELAPHELGLAAELRLSRYAARAWTGRA